MNAYNRKKESRKESYANALQYHIQSRGAGGVTVEAMVCVN